MENKIRAKADYFGAARRDMKRERSIETCGRSEGSRTTEPPARTISPSELVLCEEEIGRLEEALDQLRRPRVVFTPLSGQRRET